MHCGNPWDLKGCRQKSGEPLQHYIRRFSQKCHELSSVADADVISAFWDNTTCCTLVHELDCEQPKTTKELLDITTRHASGEEAVRATFILGNASTTTNGDRATPTKTTIMGTRKAAKGGKKGSKR
jgi:hypothetical protein